MKLIRTLGFAFCLGGFLVHAQIAQAASILDIFGEDGETASNDSGVCRSGGHAANILATPDKAAYVQMAKRLVENLPSEMSPNQAQALDAQLKSLPKPAFGAEAAAALMASGSKTSAMIMAAYAAAEAPDDPAVANNLGVTLKAFRNYPDAALALRYAKQLAPDAADVTTNLGWLALVQGDVEAARTSFEEVTAKGAPLADAYSGKGLIALCAHDYGAALPLFRQSMQFGFTDLAAAGVNSSIAGLKANGNPDPDQSASPDAYGPKQSDDFGDFSDYWPEPPIPESAERVANMIALGPKNALARYAAELEKRTVAVSLNIKPASPLSPVQSGNVVTIPRSYDKQTFILGDLRRIFDRRVQAISDPFSQQWAELYNEGFGVAQAGPLTCSSVAVADRLQPRYHRLAMDYWESLLHELADLHAFSRPWIEAIKDPAVRDTERNAQISFALAQINAMISGASNIETTIAVLWAPTDDCHKPAPADVPLKPLKNYKDDPYACKTPPVNMNFLVASFNADCDEAKWEFGEGLQVSLSYKFGKDWPDDQITIYAGHGVGESIGSSTLGAGVGAKAGGFVTFQNGAMIDGGATGSVSATATAGVFQGEVQGAGRVSMVSGFDGSISQSTSIGVPSPGDGGD